MNTYRNVQVLGGEIVGEKSTDDGATWVRFTATTILLWVDEAIDADPSRNLPRIMELADGYGEPGFFPGGYDWSGIRDSTHEARLRMFELAQTMLPMPALVAKLGLEEGYDLNAPDEWPARLPDGAEVETIADLAPLVDTLDDGKPLGFGGPGGTATRADNNRRAGHAARALIAYAEAFSGGPAPDNGEPVETVIRDLLSDLYHLTDAFGLDLVELLDRARIDYAHELLGA